MPSQSQSLADIRGSFDKVFFSPLDKLKDRYDNFDPENSILFTPLNKLKSKVEANSGRTLISYNDDEYINAESALGRTLFGPIPAGHQREFFRDKQNLWIWHENWTENGEYKEITIRYEVREDGVYKKPLGRGYTKITGAELENFRHALRAYLKLVKTILYE